jgi:hypothetical protein
MAKAKDSLECANVVIVYGKITKPLQYKRKKNKEVDIRTKELTPK